MRKYEIHRALAAPECYKFRRGHWFWKQEQYLVLHPLSFREWIFLERVMKKEEEDILHNVECCFYAVWLSVRKEDHHMTRSQLNRILNKNPKAVQDMVELLCDISLPPEPKIRRLKEVTPKDELKPVAVLVENFAMSPNEIAEMTPAQISFAIDCLQGEKSGRGGVRVGSLHEAHKLVRAMGSNN